MKYPTELECACCSAVRWEVVKACASPPVAAVAGGNVAGLAVTCPCLRRSCFFCCSSSNIFLFCNSCLAVGGWNAMLSVLIAVRSVVCCLEPCSVDLDMRTHRYVVAQVVYMRVDFPLPVCFSRFYDTI